MNFGEVTSSNRAPAQLSCTSGFSILPSMSPIHWTHPIGVIPQRPPPSFRPSYKSMSNSLCLVTKGLAEAPPAMAFLVSWSLQTKRLKCTKTIKKTKTDSTFDQGNAEYGDHFKNNWKENYFCKKSSRVNFCSRYICFDLKMPLAPKLSSKMALLLLSELWQRSIIGVSTSKKPLSS